MQTRPRFLASLALIALTVLAAALPQTDVQAISGTPDDQLLAQIGQAAGGSVQTARHAETGKLRFLALPPDHPLPRSPGLAANATPEQASRRFLTTYGKLFGLRDQAQELTVMQNESLAGNEFVRFQQHYQGIPILAGELIVQTDKLRNVISTNGEMLPDLNLSVQPRIDTAVASHNARTAITKAYKLAAADLRIAPPQLWIYNPALLGGPGLRRSTLVWRTEVSAPASNTPVRELVLIDAQSGAIALHFNQIADAKQRHVCNDNEVIDPDGDETNDCPADKYVRSEGGAATGNTDVDLAYEFAGITYDFYYNRFGRDSLNGKGLPLISLVKYCPSATECPYDNAFWDGQQMTYGSGLASADDVVGHELSHGFTEFTSHLFYYYQSGAINESLSDVFGELIDQSDGMGLDTPEVRWELGEDLPASVGVIRNMRNPGLFNDPDRTGSADYKGDSRDNGQVHSNSGVNNKATYLITDGTPAGQPFNGITVQGIGLNKTAALYYTLNLAFLTSGSDYQDLYTDLQAACASLASTAAYSITTADCTEVKHALDATEMNLTPANTQIPDVAVCAGGKTSNDLFFDDLENSQNGNWVSAATSGTVSEWFYPASNNTYAFDARYATSGTGNFWGNDYGGTSSDIDPPSLVGDYNIAMTHDVTVPVNGLLHFRHAFEFESDFDNNYDGGVVEYSTDRGATWQDAGALFTAGNGANGYNVQLSASNNPLAEREAFGDTSQGYTSSRADLSTLAGKHVRFRFRIGTDETTGFYGWFIDDVRIYTCTSTPPTVAFTVANQNVLESTGSVTVEVGLSGVVSQTLIIPFTVTGTASLNLDYTLPSNVFIIPAGQRAAKLALPIVWDILSEPDETIVLTLGTPANAALVTPITQTITIQNSGMYQTYLPTLRN